MLKTVKRMIIWSLILCLFSSILGTAWAEDGDLPPINWDWLDSRKTTPDSQAQQAMRSIASGWQHSVALRSDGTVVAMGYNEDGECDVGTWKDIVAVSAGSFHTVGLRSDGTVVAVGWNEYGQCDVGTWRDIRTGQ